MSFPEEDTEFAVRHRATRLYLTSGENDATVTLAPYDPTSPGRQRWTSAEGRLRDPRSGRVVAFDEANHGLLMLADSGSAGPDWTLVDGRIAVGERDGATSVFPVGGGLLRVADIDEMVRGYVDLAFEIVPGASLAGQRTGRPPVKEVDKELRKWLNLMQTITSAAITSLFAIGSVPGGGLVSGLFNAYWDWFKGQVLYEIPIEQKLEMIMDWVEAYTEEKISEIVRAEIQSAYEDLLSPANAYTVALVEYENAESDGERNYWRNQLNNRFPHCRDALNSIITRCANYPPEYGRDRIIFTYCMAISFYCTIIRDRLTSYREWQVPSVDVGQLKSELYDKASHFFTNMQAMLNKLPLLQYFTGSAGRTDCHIGRDPNQINDLDTTDTLRALMTVMRTMRAIAYYNPRNYQNVIEFAHGTGELTEEGKDLQIRPTMPESEILQPFHLGSERLPHKATSQYSIAVTMSRPTKEDVTVRCLFASVHSDHPDSKFAYNGDVIPSSITMNGSTVHGEKALEVSYRILFDSEDRNREFWSRTGVVEGFDAYNYTKYVYLDFGTHTFEPGQRYTLNFPTGSRLCVADICFVDPERVQPPPKPPAEFLKDVDGEYVDPRADYHLVLRTDHSIYLTPNADRTRLELTTTTPKHQTRVAKEKTEQPYDRLRPTDAFSIDFVNKYPPTWHFPLRLTTGGNLDPNLPAQYYLLTRRHWLQLTGTEKKLAEADYNPGRVVLSDKNEKNLTWGFKKIPQ